ncbi:hypothetical protein HL653_10630 [Sphingomonas sp. AP4-R1]|uniref:hypothetical protein n=1 Tax=Sphingomonas sp. AP4-R1 TaxID=2735134 RepID=UPI0014936309|nr:hypothetical protein [Sphingomonas sp. AP4-R1]QJU58191.1 hypothetical protein HL653_10630 [Sphingomonas sp. AP4-R1]
MTFSSYLLGWEQLLKDRVEGGSGILILEEALGARWGRGHAKHGIEGMIDAALKVFGL